MHKTIIYGAAWCGWCLKAKDFFEKNNIPYEWRDTDKEDNEKEAIKKSGQRAIPVIDINGKIFVGFDEEKIKKEIDRFKKENKPLKLIR